MTGHYRVGVKPVSALYRAYIGKGLMKARFGADKDLTV